MYYLDTGLGDENKDLYECTKNSEISLGMLYEAGMLKRSNGLDVLADLAYHGKIRFTNLDSEVISNASEVTLYGK